MLIYFDRFPHFFSTHVQIGYLINSPCLNKCTFTIHLFDITHAPYRLPILQPLKIESKQMKIFKDRRKCHTASITENNYMVGSYRVIIVATNIVTRRTSKA